MPAWRVINRRSGVKDKAWTSAIAISEFEVCCARGSIGGRPRRSVEKKGEESSLKFIFDRNKILQEIQPALKIALEKTAI